MSRPCIDWLMILTLDQLWYTDTLDESTWFSRGWIPRHLSFKRLNLHWPWSFILDVCEHRALSRSCSDDGSGCEVGMCLRFDIRPHVHGTCEGVFMRLSLRMHTPWRTKSDRCHCSLGHQGHSPFQTSHVLLLSCALLLYTKQFKDGCMY